MSVPVFAISVLRVGRTASPPMSWAKLGAALGCCDVTAKRWARLLGLDGPKLESIQTVTGVWARADVHARLVQGWADPDESAADIGLALSAMVGRPVSANAVIGRAHRAVLGPKAARRQARSGHIRGARPRPPADPEIAERRKAARAEVAARRASPVTELRPADPPRPAPPARTGKASECCYPIGEPRTPTFRWCSEPSQPGSVYCAPHHAICRVPVRDGRLGMANAA